MWTLSNCVLALEDSQIVAVHEGEAIKADQFRLETEKLAAGLSLLEEQRFALFYEQAYPFTVALFALLHAGKQVWIPGNNKNTTASQLQQEGCCLIGEWGHQSIADLNENAGFVLQPLDLQQAEIIILTSGSTGQPKAILKALWQLQREIDTLETLWGSLLKRVEILATVSHQHIYGLLFRVLWPLLAGRCFHSAMYLSPEPLLLAAKSPACWIASPAQLKRLDELTPWAGIKQLTAIFSSGGLLPRSAAELIEQCCGQNVIEVYGSSETGGIAWRQQLQHVDWLPFDGLQLQIVANERVQLSSPFLLKPILLDDRIELKATRRFALSGRLDRIVKVEEKRVSLDSLEQEIKQLPWVNDAWTLLVAERRDKLAAALVLSDDGKALMNQQGRAKLIRRLRAALMDSFETVILPRKWLFMERIPLTSQGKTATELLISLMKLDSKKFPQLLFCDLQQDKVKLDVRIPSDLIYFTGHFPDYPILPGVTQLFWAEQFGKLFFSIVKPFLQMEAVKFKKIIQPEQHITIELEWKADTGKLYFDFSSVTDGHSSGRIVYGDPM
jgi:acyl-CoA synthetase (AMP-forming)/AMP-acid ligase II